jgi:branched-subunit amino acid aminotransferase/4-amino-4-deoxychorismate lyase
MSKCTNKLFALCRPKYTNKLFALRRPKYTNNLFSLFAYPKCTNKLSALCRPKYTNNLFSLCAYPQCTNKLSALCRPKYTNKRKRYKKITETVIRETDNTMANTKRDKSTCNYLQSITHKTKDLATRTPFKPWVNSGDPGG